MQTFEYPVQYFSCKDFEREDMDSFFHENMQSWAKMGAAIGEIKGNTDIQGLKLDFCNGLRLQVPAGKWHIRLSDADSGMIFYDADISEHILVSVEKYYIHWLVEAYLEGEKVFEHIFDPMGKRIHFVYCSSRLGDTLACVPYMLAFQKKYRVKASYYVTSYLRELLAEFCEIPYSETVEEDTYAAFYFSAGRDDPSKCPLDGRQFPLWQVGQVILNLPRPEVFPAWRKTKRRIKEPYVCIGVQGSNPIKGWHYPGGWDMVVADLQRRGYRVLCIDKDAYREGPAGLIAQIPHGAEDFTGDISLVERADMLYHAEFFVGLSSGLSWLAWAVHCPVVLIGGFSASWYEFPTTCRVYNRLACHGCFTDPRIDWPKNPCHLSSREPTRLLECSRTISPAMVMSAVDGLLSGEKDE